MAYVKPVDWHDHSQSIDSAFWVAYRLWVEKIKSIDSIDRIPPFFLLTTRDVAVKLKKKYIFTILGENEEKKCENQAVYCGKIFSSDFSE